MNYLILLLSINLWSFNALPSDVLTFVEKKSLTQQTTPCTFETESTKGMETSKTIKTAMSQDRDWRFRYRQMEYISPLCPDGYIVVCNNPGQNCSSVIMPTCFNWPDE